MIEATAEAWAVEWRENPAPGEEAVSYYGRVIAWEPCDAGADRQHLHPYVIAYDGLPVRLQGKVTIYPTYDEVEGDIKDEGGEKGTHCDVN
jgi:hypothetical protein